MKFQLIPSFINAFTDILSRVRLINLDAFKKWKLKPFAFRLTDEPLVFTFIRSVAVI